MRILHVLLATLGLAACYSDDNAGGGGDLADFAREVQERFCAAQVACGDYASEADCQAASPLDLDAIEAAIAAGKVVFRPENVDACLDAIDVSSTCSLSTALAGLADGTSTACTDALEGTVAAGGTCFDGIECLSGRCDPPDDCVEQCCAGVCTPEAAETRGEIDQACGGEALCVAGAYCDSASSTCKARPAEGEPCTELFACVTTAVCDLDFTTGTGVCAKLALHATTCNPDSLIPCDRLDDYCDPSTLVCSRLPGSGQACSEPAGCLSHATCTAGICVANPKAGEACAADGPECQGSLECMTGECGPVAEPACW